jgi:hypothetical protein
LRSSPAIARPSLSVTFALTRINCGATSRTAARSPFATTPRTGAPMRGGGNVFAYSPTKRGEILRMASIKS